MTAAPAKAHKPVETVKAPAETEKPQRPAAAAHKDEFKSAPASKPAAGPAVTASQAKAPEASKPAQRPGTSNTPNRPVAQAYPNSPFEPKGKQPVTATRGVMNSNTSTAASGTQHDNKAITPVSTVKKSKKRKEPKAAKDPGLAGLITFLGIIVLAIGVLWALDSTSGIKSLFGKKPVETISTEGSDWTTETSEIATEASVIAEVTTTKETTTEATTTTTEATTTTTEATTTTTEATTTTTEATTTTTTEATTTTTEATTTTTEATTKSTTKATRSSKTADGYAINDFDTKISNFATTAGGFKFDIQLKNKSNYTANLPKSLKGLDIKLYSSSTITDVTSDAMTFTGDGTSYRGVPNEIAVDAGDTYTFTVYVTTSSSVNSYGYNYAFFDWVK